MVKLDYDKSYRKGRLICDEPIFSLVRNHFSVNNPDAAFANRKLKAQGKKPTIPTRKFLIGDSGLFDFGLFDEILKFLIGEQITEIEKTDSFENRLKIGFDDISVSDDLSLQLRDYQGEALNRAFSVGCGTIVVGTGGGKSLLQASLLENWKQQNPDFKGVVIVPGTSLVNQLVNDFTNYKVSFTFSGWTGTTDLQDTQVVIVNSENFCARFENNFWITEVDVLLTDECHKIKQANVLTKLISKIKTPNKFGFTGTLPKEKEDIWKIIGTFGPVIYEKRSKELRDEKYLSNVHVKIIQYFHKKVNRISYQKEVEFLQEHEGRNKFIVDLATKLNKNTMIMVNRLDHGDLLMEELQSRNTTKKFVFIKGEVEVEERMKVLEEMENSNDVICIAMSSIFSTGINIKNLHYIIFVSGGKSFIRTVQSIGRGLRLHEFKERLLLFDIYDNYKYSSSHVEERKTFYNDEQIEWSETTINL